MAQIVVSWMVMNPMVQSVTKITIQQIHDLQRDPVFDLPIVFKGFLATPAKATPPQK